jgi:hypothetical protein
MRGSPEESPSDLGRDSRGPSSLVETPSGRHHAATAIAAQVVEAAEYGAPADRHPSTFLNFAPPL